MIEFVVSIGLVDEHSDRIEVMLGRYDAVELNEKTTIIIIRFKWEIEEKDRWRKILLYLLPENIIYTSV